MMIYQQRRKMENDMRKITLSPETRARVEAMLNAMVQDHCDFVAGVKDKKDFPGSFAVKEA